jgi:hypothetical protein
MEGVVNILMQSLIHRTVGILDKTSKRELPGSTPFLTLLRDDGKRILFMVGEFYTAAKMGRFE